jgi:hypothetical protein
MIEIQIHPSDIRRRVRYFFFDRRHVVSGTHRPFVRPRGSDRVDGRGSHRHPPRLQTNSSQQREERAIQRERLRTLCR